MRLRDFHSEECGRRALPGLSLGFGYWERARIQGGSELTLATPSAHTRMLTQGPASLCTEAESG